MFKLDPWVGGLLLQQNESPFIYVVCIKIIFYCICTIVTDYFAV
jgi:hypothetical protein